MGMEESETGMSDQDRPPRLRLAEMTSHDLATGEQRTAILPIGATEFHGPHLPFGTDTIAAEAISLRIAEELGSAVVLPALDYGMSLHMMGWPWSLSLRPATLTQVVIDIAESLWRHGVREVVVVSAHDGNPPSIEQAAREVSDRHGMTLVIVSDWQEAARELLRGRFDIDRDHGGQSEMSLTLFAAPTLARIDLAVDLPNQQMDHPATVRGPFSNVVPHGYSGAPRKGTAAEGAAIVDAVAAAVVPFLRQLREHGWRNGPWMSGITPPAAAQDPRHAGWR